MIDKTQLYQSLLKLFCFLISLLVPAALLLGGVMRSISPAYPHQVYKFLPADELGLTQTERLDLALITLAYLQHPEPAATAVRFLESQHLPDTDQPLYNERELAHLVDVKQLTDRLGRWSETLNWLLGLSLLALLAWPATRLAAVKAFQRGAVLSFFLLTACFMFILSFWPLFFFRLPLLALPAGQLELCRRRHPHPAFPRSVLVQLCPTGIRRAGCLRGPAAAGDFHPGFYHGHEGRADRTIARPDSRTVGAAAHRANRPLLRPGSLRPTGLRPRKP